MAGIDDDGHRGFDEIRVARQIRQPAEKKSGGRASLRFRITGRARA